MRRHRDPNDDRPQTYLGYAAAALVSGLFLFTAVAGLVVFLALVFSNWWWIALILLAAGFLISVVSNDKSRPVDDYENVMGLIRR